MTTKIFPSRHTPLRLLTPTTALSWITSSVSHTCLVTGQENGNIGVTWYPKHDAVSSQNHFSSLTLSYDSLTRITHIRCCPKHSHVAVGDANGTLMLLSIKQPYNGVTRMLTSVSTTPQTIVGLDWSHDGDNLACLRASSERGSQLVLLVYSNLSQTQIGHTEVAFPKNVVRHTMMAFEHFTASQRIAWSRDDSRILLTTPDYSIIELSTQTWQITTRYHLHYCTHIQSISPTQLLASDEEGRLFLYNTSTNLLKQLREYVENWMWSESHKQLLAVTRQEEYTCDLSVISLEGYVLSRHELPTSGCVTSFSLNPDSTVLTYTTDIYMCSVILYTCVPSLSDLCMRIIADKNVATSSLPQRMQRDVSIHHNVLVYPWSMSDAVELSVYLMEKRSAVGPNCRMIMVKKDHLGQELDVLRFSGSNRFWNRSVVLKTQQSSIDQMLCYLLSSCLTDPPSNCKIKWNANKDVFTLRAGAEKMILGFSSQLDDFVVTFRDGNRRILMTDKSGVFIMQTADGEVLMKLSNDRSIFRLKLYKMRLFSPLQILMIVLSFIIRNF